ncbi:MAG: sensor histidine kinase [Gemmataceae bacterium]
MPPRNCVFFSDKHCDPRACPALPFLRDCPLLEKAPARPAAPPRVLGARWRPALAFVVVLIAIFAAEYAVMLILPRVLPPESPRVLEAVVDAVVLTAVLAPLVWWTVVRPLREVIHLRARFLTDLFSRIETDRRGTAHELHDGVGQSLSLLVSGLRSAHEAAGDPAAAARTDHLLQLARQALKDVKRLALGMRPSLLDDLGLAPALERLAADVRDNHPIELLVDIAALAGQRFPDAVETTVFRIVQEALANVVVHSGAHHASVRVRRGERRLELEVIDDGAGFDLSDGKLERGHLGLIGMRERALLLGGDFTINTAPGEGTHIAATIPIG